MAIGGGAPAGPGVLLPLQAAQQQVRARSRCLCACLLLPQQAAQQPACSGCTRSPAARPAGHAGKLSMLLD